MQRFAAMLDHRRVRTSGAKSAGQLLVALGFVLLPVTHHVRWDHGLVRALTYVPFAFILLGIALGGLSLFGLQTVLFGYGFHF